MKKKIFLITTSLIAHLSFAQVLLSEDFNSYAAGHLNTNYTGTTAGQGGWLTERHANAVATAIVTPESGRGNVLSFTTTGTFSNEYVTVKQNTGVISALWNNRTVGNNVLKYEYEVLGDGWFQAYSGVKHATSLTTIALYFQSAGNKLIETFHPTTNSSWKLLINYAGSTVPHNKWLKVELFIDYNTNKLYTYIPTLNLFAATVSLPSTIGPNADIEFFAEWLKLGSIVKYDNIKLTALPSVPNYILSATELITDKFNMYPNPATNVVNITNTENMLVEQVIVSDINGKQVSTQNYNSEQPIQLNVENLASGTYMVHIQTNAGLAIKQLVKK